MAARLRARWGPHYPYRGAQPKPNPSSLRCRSSVWSTRRSSWRYAKRHGEPPSTLPRPDQSVEIYSESLSALETITNSNAPPPLKCHSLALEARDYPQKALIQSKYISLFRIKNHAWLEGNKHADYLKREVAMKSKTQFDYESCLVHSSSRKFGCVRFKNRITGTERVNGPASLKSSFCRQ
ncbi:unnamed protein product [Euphydryas editha]|uniref:RNase H type-1 domain-containing protein n=1 Tax=Euphydryas editha TaxID=104508 RepID=A0AAU9U0K9_EUPED|nr:unnamed protein product [Euphydryas editha]